MTQPPCVMMWVAAVTPRNETMRSRSVPQSSRVSLHAYRSTSMNMLISSGPVLTDSMYGAGAGAGAGHPSGKNTSSMVTDVDRVRGASAAMLK